MKITGDFTLEGEERRKLITNLIRESIIVDRMEVAFHKLIGAMDKKVPFGPSEKLNPYLNAITLTGIDIGEEEGYFELLSSIYDAHFKGKFASVEDSAEKTAEIIYKEWVLATKKKK